jgi:autotransporter-associated beta strand protein
VSLAADGTFTITNGPDNGFIFAISTLSPTAYIDLGSNTWRTNNIFGGGTIKTSGKLSTGLFGDGTFDGVLTGSGSLNIGSLTEGDADHTTVLTGNNTFTGGVTLYRGTLVARNLRNGQLTIGDPAAAGGSVSKVQIASKTVPNDPTGTSVVPSLTINGAAQLDLTNNSMVIDYTGPVGSLVGDTRANLVSGKITSTAADASHKLGYGDNAILHKTTFGGQTVDTSSLLIKFTFPGDANLDGQVDVTDLGALATSWQTSAPWTGGDFDYSGFVDVTDLGALATNWQAGVGSPLGRASFTDALAAVGLGGVSVPEPATMGIIALGAWSLKRPRRRN